MIVGTPASRRACEDAARRSGDTVILAFSRGKDSVAAWLWLLEFFPRVIPFHCAAVPGLGFVDRSLAYYERQFGTPIDRYVAGELYGALSQLVYQPPHAEDWIDGLDFESHTINDVVTDVRRRHGCPGAWVAYGISKTDSIVRRSAKKYDGGSSLARRTLYPCFDWPKAQVLAAIESAGVGLAEDYLLGNRSLAGVPTERHLLRMREMYPEDYERVKFFYPLIEARLARNEFRRLRQLRSREPVGGVTTSLTDLCTAPAG